jgi:2-polyprenyl-3-methyl-5-hydroxy-6-metoxy-1,4-benzoquinol methylase
MRAAMRKLLRTTGKRLGLGKLFWYFYGLLQESSSKDSSKNSKVDKVFGFFTDSYGNQTELYSGLRDRIKPGWQAMFHPASASVPMSPDACLAKIKSWRDNLERVDSFLRIYALSFDKKDVVEIGAHDGSTAYALAEAGAKTVLATDMAAYYITQSPNGVVTEDAIAAKNEDLARLRDAYGKSVDKLTAQRVVFLEDDICSSSLRSASADAVMSWEVLEHMTRPEEAFRQIARILKPGGFAFHEYNPFFSINGGHSLCTLDFLWGHARLQDTDFERYLEKLRPAEEAVSISFYRNNLNRMTLCELEHYAKQAGLSLLCLLPFCSKKDLAQVRYETLSQCKHIYPSVGLLDLISQTVWVILKKNK